MAFDASIPPWLVPKESPIDAMVKGVQAGTAIARTMQAGRQLALEAQRQQDQHELAEKQFDLQSKTQSLHNDILLRDVDAQQTDLPKWQDFTAKVNAAKTPDELSSVMESIPSFESDEYLSRAHSDIVTRSKVIGATSFAQAVAEQNLAEAKVVGYNAAWASELGKYPLNSPERVKALGGFQATMRQEEGEAALKLRTASAEVAGQYRLMTGEQTAETRLALEGLKNAGRDQNGAVQAQPLLLLDGSVDPDHVIVRSGNANKIIHVQDKDKFKALTAPQQISSLRTVISANNMLLKQTTDEKEQAGFRANIIGYTKDLDNLLKGSGKGSAAPSVGKTLKWNPDTNDFE